MVYNFFKNVYIQALHKKVKGWFTLSLSGGLIMNLRIKKKIF